VYYERILKACVELDERVVDNVMTDAMACPPASLHQVVDREMMLVWHRSA